MNKKDDLCSFRRLFIFLLATLSVVAAYIELSHFWVGCGGVRVNNFYFEMPFILFLLLLFYFPIRNKKIKFVFPIIPILCIYLTHDIFYNFLGRSPRVSDIKNASTLMDFSPVLATGFVIGFLLICLPILFLIFRFYQENKTITFFKIIFCKGMLLLLGVSLLSSDMFIEYQKKTLKGISWSQERTIILNGRFASLFYYKNKEKEALTKLITYKGMDTDNTKKLYPNKILANKRNIYFVILESFIDPRLLKGVQYNRSPLSDKLIPYLRDKKEFSYVISPVYGGGTAQAEFELLTGIKAYGKVDTIEFNVMAGHPMFSLINKLKENDYSSVAVIATDSRYYNSKAAYKSLGFEKTVFLKEEKDFKKTEGDYRIFDGDIFKYNFNRIANEDHKPIFSYILGMFGHYPYEENIKKRPDIIKTSNIDDRIQRISNQFYYRTEALGEYIEKLIQRDPNSIIYVTSDHLPPIITENIQYAKDKYENISLLIIDGQIVDISGKKYYEIPWIIWDTLTGTNEIRKLDDNEMEDIYFKAMSESI